MTVIDIQIIVLGCILIGGGSFCLGVVMGVRWFEEGFAKGLRERKAKYGN